MLIYIERYGNYNDDPGVKEKGMDCLTLLLSETNNVHAAKKFNIDAKDDKGMTPLHHAAIQKNDSYVVELIERFEMRKILYQLFFSLPLPNLWENILL